jgi:hypothetical protein
MNELIGALILATCVVFGIVWLFDSDPELEMTWTDKIFMFLNLEAIACGLISGVYILVGGTNGIHI